MTPADIRFARGVLRLSVADTARLLDTDETTIHRIERAKEAKTHRPPPARVARLLRAYLDGYRPPDWPSHAKGDIDKPDRG